MPSNKNNNSKISMPARVKKRLAITNNNTTHRNRNITAPNLIIDGTYHSPSFAKNRMAISMATATLSNMGMMKNPVIDQKTNLLSEDFLNAIAVSLVDSERGYSLMSCGQQSTILDPEQEENFGNPNILDASQYSFLKNEKETSTNSFPNCNDPFYQLDSPPTSQYVKKFDQILDREKRPDIIKISSHMSQINFIPSKESQKLKYFNSTEARIQNKWSQS